MHTGARKEIFRIFSTFQKAQILAHFCKKSAKIEIFRGQNFDSGLFVYETFSSENFVSEFFSSLSRFRLRFLCLYLLFDILDDNFGPFCVLSL